MTNLTPQEPLRMMTALERSYIERLLTAEFPGREQVAEQLRSALARRIDDKGSLELVPKTNALARVVKRIPVEGEGTDIDGVPIYFLLHVVDARVRELEIYKADGGLIKRMPVPEQIQVMVLPP